MSRRLELTPIRTEAGLTLDPEPLRSGSVLPVHLLPGRLRIIQGPGTITFTLNGIPRWIIDERRFAGSPKLKLTVGATETRIVLEGARLPGTLLPADFSCVVGKPGPLGTPGTFTFTFGGFHAQVFIERWLAGVEPMQSTVTVSGEVCPLGATSHLQLSGTAVARFRPNWSMSLSGPAIAAISGLSAGPDLTTASFRIKLLSPTDPTISAHPDTLRTLLSLAADTETWDLPLAATTLPIGELSASPGLFQTIEIEAGEDVTGIASRQLLATSSSDSGLTLAVAGDLKDLDGKPFALTLSRPTYAIAFDSSADRSVGDETLLLSGFAPTPAWLVVEGFALLVGNPNGVPGFQLETLSGQVTSFRCSPALISAAAPITAGAESNIVAAPSEMFDVLLSFVTEPAATPGWGVIAGPAIAGRPRLSLPDFRVSLLRREDLLALDYLFYNLALEAGGGSPPQLVRKDPTQPSFLVARFNAPQNIAEQAYFEASPDTTPAHPAPPPGTDPQHLDPEVPGSSSAFPLVAQSRAAGPSRLAFALPPGTDSLPYTVAGLLDWVSLDQSIVPVAHIPDPNQPDVPEPLPVLPRPAIREPSSTETAIEAPWRLFLSPNYAGTWAHSADPVTLSARTELWHTRLAVRKQNGDGAPVADETIPRRVRAVWSPDYSPGAIPPHPGPPFDATSGSAPFRMSLDPDDRDQIVRLSSDLTLRHRARIRIPYDPVSISADKLFLSSLGAWLDVFGNWPDPLPIGNHAIFSVEQWQHRAAMGRDNYVRVVYAGYLLPFGHAASLVKVTERKLQSVNGGATTAYLRQRFFVVVREPEKSFSALSESEQRKLPFRSVRITTLVTPDVSPRLDDFGRYAFFPTSGPNTFLFHLIGTDWEGQASEFTAPLYFVERGGDNPAAVLAFNSSGVGTRNLSGQKVAFAPSGKPGDTTFHASTLAFSAQLSSNFDSPFFAQMEAADIVVPSIQQLTGGPGEMPVEYYAPYVASGMNAGEVFLAKSGAPLSVGFNGKQSGGVATPNLTVSGLSRLHGTVSGATPDNVAAGTYKASDIFGDPGAKLFGVVSLSDLIGDLANLVSTAPTLTTDRSIPNQIKTTLAFTPTVQPNFSAFGGFIDLTFNDTAHLDKAFNLEATIITPLTGGSPQVTIHGELNNFTLSLAKVIGITINQIAFNAPAGQKLTVSASMPPNDDNGPLQFLGDLSFLNALQKFIPSDGFEDPPSLDVTADGITAGYTLPIPSIGVGIFSVENISLAAQLTLPFFTPAPIRFRFAFSEREHPFLISVSLLGGGGFFGITVGPDGVEILEASLEFGANVSISIVVASGNVHIMAGVYLKFDMVSNSSQLTGYLRAGGSLDVLGLISASVEFYLGFTYYFGPPCKIAGEATITIEVHVLFFSASVSASLRREFGDPVISFADLIGPGDWDYYCDSFAA